LVEFNIHNNSNQILYIYIDKETFLDEVSPGEDTVWTIDRIYSDYELIAKDADGNVLYIADYTRSDIHNKYEIDVYFPPKENGSGTSTNITDS
jgi:hypothetical protein